MPGQCHQAVDRLSVGEREAGEHGPHPAGREAEDEALWREVAGLHQKHTSPQKAVDRLVQVLIWLARSNRILQVMRTIPVMLKTAAQHIPSPRMASNTPWSRSTTAPRRLLPGLQRPQPLLSRCCCQLWTHHL